LASGRLIGTPRRGTDWERCTTATHRSRTASHSSQRLRSCCTWSGVHTDLTTDDPFMQPSAGDHVEQCRLPTSRSKWPTVTAGGRPATGGPKPLRLMQEGSAKIGTAAPAENHPRRNAIGQRPYPADRLLQRFQMLPFRGRGCRTMGGRPPVGSGAQVHVQGLRSARCRCQAAVRESGDGRVRPVEPFRFGLDIHSRPVQASSP
jgi:hypothetical protein